jgi:hypothetical protein
MELAALLSLRTRFGLTDLAELAESVAKPGRSSGPSSAKAGRQTVRKMPAQTDIVYVNDHLLGIISTSNGF